MSRTLQNRAKRAHESPKVTNNGKSRATLRRLSSTVKLSKKGNSVNIEDEFEV